MNDVKRELDVDDLVKINMETVNDPESIEKRNVDAVGRVIGFAGGDYQVLFFADQGPLWFGRDELVFPLIGRGR